MSSSNHRTRLSLMFTPTSFHVFVKKNRNSRLSGDMPFQRPDSPPSPISPTYNSPFRMPPVAVITTGQEKKNLLKKARRLSQVTGDATLPSPTVDDGEEAILQSQGSTWSTSVGASERDRLVRPTPNVAIPSAKSSNVAHSSTYPLHHLSALNSSRERPHTQTTSESGHSVLSNTTTNQFITGPEDSKISSAHPAISQHRRAGLPKFDEGSAEGVTTGLTRSLTNSETPSLRSRQVGRIERRISLDSYGLSQRVTPVSSVGNSAKKAPVQRSRSALAGRVAVAHSERMLDEVREGSFDRGSLTPEPSNEKQRALNVKRARKMAQLFGSEPPQALFQISHVEHDEERSTSFENHRTSFATLLSTSTSNLLSMAPPPGLRQRTTSNASSIVLPESPSSTPMTGPEPDTSQEETDPATPPPFSDVVVPSCAPTAPAPEKKLSPELENEFRQRRLRAAKLSKFFGVGYQDLQPHLPERIPSGAQVGCDTLVEVAIGSTKGTFWDRSHNHQQQYHRETDMQDVIHRLREMKAA